MVTELRYPIPYDWENFPFTQIKREARLGNFLNQHPRVLRLLSKPANWKNLAEAYAVSDRDMKLANAIPKHDEDIGYTGDEEILAFLHYRRQLREGSTHQATESGALDDKQLKLI